MPKKLYRESKTRNQIRNRNKLDVGGSREQLVLKTPLALPVSDTKSWCTVPSELSLALIGNASAKQFSGRQEIHPRRFR